MLEPDYEDEEQVLAEVECGRCGKGGLHWEETDEGWRLASPSGLLHKCDPARLQRMAANDFDDVSTGRGT
ncbi:hypothetical protein [Ralstonia syzygii]|uniref:hypothetical protein n=1 Tax=Ralstonia syzygii TaxID=28097 RepID=UPI0035144F64